MAMWKARRRTITPAICEKVTVEGAGRTLSFAEVIQGWRDDAAFREFFLRELAATPYSAFVWEMPPVARGHIDIAYEYVAVRCDALARPRADASAFREELEAAGGESMAVFGNLGGDALLIAPRPDGNAPAWGHLAAFLHAAPLAMQHALLQALAEAILRLLAATDERIWISTSGLGVPWLHVRLDSAPKYHQHRPYAEV
ncbi:MAG TPA: hypothetical protein VGF97_11670 [Rhizomicrobium sp.]